MQQMNNILLGNSSKPADASTKVNVQDIENKTFLSAFNQASESGLILRRNANTAQVSFDAEAGKANAGIASELSTDENADVEMIFAQLNMADSINKRHSSGGKELPHVEQSEVYFDTTFSAEAPNSAVVEKTNNDVGVSELFTDTIDLPADSITTKEAISQLSAEELDNLMAFADLSVKDLQALDPQALNVLISDFNLQAPVIDESILAMVEVDMDSSDESPDSKLNSEQQNQIDKSVATSVAIQGKASATDVNSALNSAAVKSDMTGPLSSGLSRSGLSSSGFSSSATSVEATSAMNVDPETILGDNARINSNVQVDTDNAKVLAKADFSVVLDSLAIKRASGEPSTHLTPANFGLDAVADVSETDNKTLQNHNSFTSVNKSDVPQFQLSIRPQGEAGAQMQEMIQRFSPVMKQQLITMVSNGVQQAEIRLDPAELGHLTIKIQIQGDQTQVQFHVAQSQTRDIVEQAMPRLREMLAQEGLQLTDSHVSQGDGGSEQQHEQSGDHSGEGRQLDEISTQEVSLLTDPSRSLHSAIDYYA
ncbi:MAG: flagellar hook-length control protein FliK [Shewanella psychromarinicola]|uniref:flagellar hook-length control protein FliK n=1 Tax=Shewanella psychromarinicola TaxID=2487742 RepID=UPI0030031D2C